MIRFFQKNLAIFLADFITAESFHVCAAIQFDAPLSVTGPDPIKKDSAKAPGQSAKPPSRSGLYRTC